MEPTSNTVYQTICALYHNDDPKEKEDANKWLQQFQQSTYAWRISNELLQQKRDIQSCYFAAQTMRNKVQTSFQELPTESQAILRDCLITHLRQITAETSPIIATQLNLALVDLAIQMTSWKQPVDDMLQLFDCSTTTGMTSALEILKVLPEEIDSRLLRLEAKRRENIMQQLEKAAPKVLSFLETCQQTAQQQEHLLNAILGCSSSWLTLELISAQRFAEVSGQHVFQLLSAAECTDKLHDTATDWLCTLLECFGKDDKNFSLEIINAVASLKQHYEASVTSNNINKARNYARCFTALCESFLVEMTTNVKAPHFSVQCLDLLLVCFEHYDHEVAEITFYIWTRLSDELYKLKNKQLTVHFKTYIERLLSAIFKHAQLNPHQKGLIEGSSLDYRQRLADLVGDIVFIVGASCCFEQMFGYMQTVHNNWHLTEAGFFIMQCVARKMHRAECKVVPQVIEVILSIPPGTHIALQNTSIMLLGQLSNWLDEHPQMLNPVLSFLYSVLQQRKGLDTAAATALTSIFNACSRSSMSEQVDGLVAIAQLVNGLNITNELAQAMHKSVSKVTFRLPCSVMATVLRQLLALQLQPLAELIATGFLDADYRSECRVPVYWLNQACALMHHKNVDSSVDVSLALLDIFTDALSVIGSTMNKYQADEGVMERACRFIMNGLRLIRKRAVPLVEALAKQIVCWYAQHRHSCLLYLGSVLIDECGGLEETTPVLLEMLKNFAETALHTLQMENGLQNLPSTVMDFFTLSSRFLRYSPLAFMQSPCFVPIVQCALHACTLEHREANATVMDFLYKLLKCGRMTEHRALVKEFALQIGQMLAQTLLYASVNCLLSCMLEDVTKVLSELGSVVRTNKMVQYVRTALDLLPKGRVLVEHLRPFYKSLSVRDNSAKYIEALKELKRLFR